jgi:hypothetical protein
LFPPFFDLGVFLFCWRFPPFVSSRLGGGVDRGDGLDRVDNVDRGDGFDVGTGSSGLGEDSSFGLEDSSELLLLLLLVLFADLSAFSLETVAYAIIPVVMAINPYAITGIPPI